MEEGLSIRHVLLKGYTPKDMPSLDADDVAENKGQVAGIDGSAVDELVIQLSAKRDTAAANELTAYHDSPRSAISSNGLNYTMVANEQQPMPMSSSQPMLQNQQYPIYQHTPQQHSFQQQQHQMFSYQQQPSSWQQQQWLTFSYPQFKQPIITIQQQMNAYQNDVYQNVNQMPINQRQYSIHHWQQQHHQNPNYAPFRIQQYCATNNAPTGNVHYAMNDNQGLSTQNIIHDVNPPVIHYGSPNSEALKLQKAPADPTLSISCCHEDLNAAPIPINLLDDTSSQTTLLEKEIAWLVEETHFILPQLSKEKAVILFDLAWLFGSLELRCLLFKKYNKLVASKFNGSDRSKISSTNFVDANKLLRIETDNKKFQTLRNDVLDGLNLGFRRCDALGKILNKVRRFRLRRALEERGNDEDQALDSLTVRRMRRKRKRRSKDVDPLSNIGSLSMSEMEKMAMEQPEELNEIEEEIAWLCEESLLLPPKLNNAPKSAKDYTVSAGLVTEAPEVDWGFVIEHASPALKFVLDKIRGDVGNRTLQRVVRNSQLHVRVSFNKRREVIANLITIGGFRRPEIKEALPSNDELIQSGFSEIFRKRLMRRMQQRKTEELASSYDLNVACNQRIGDVPSSLPKKHNVRLSAQPPKKKRRSESSSNIDSEKALLASHKRTDSPSPPDCAHVLLSEQPNTSLLTMNEVELAWLRVEFELETGLKGFNWEYIEKYATANLRHDMMIRGVLFSVYPTIGGISKLKLMVRLDDEEVYRAFRQKMRDIRWAITKYGFRRDLRKNTFPDIPAAPPRLAGAYVTAVEYADYIEQMLCHGHDADLIALVKASRKQNHPRLRITGRGDDSISSGFEFICDQPTRGNNDPHQENNMSYIGNDITHTIHPPLAFNPKTDREISNNRANQKKETYPIAETSQTDSSEDSVEDSPGLNDGLGASSNEESSDSDDEFVLCSDEDCKDTYL